MVGVFISHGWTESKEEYRRLAFHLRSWIEEELDEPVRDHSVPEDRRIRDWLARIPFVLDAIIKDRINKADVYVVIAHPRNTEWIEKETKYADKIGKSILAIKHPERERMAGFVNKLGLEWVDYDGRSVRAAIKRMLRNAN